MASTDRTGPEDVDLDVFGRNVAELRAQAGLSQTALSERACIHRAEISAIEHGLRDPSLETLVKLAGALGHPVARLFDGIV